MHIICQTASLCPRGRKWWIWDIQDGRQKRTLSWAPYAGAWRQRGKEAKRRLSVVRHRWGNDNHVFHPKVNSRSRDGRTLISGCWCRLDWGAESRRRLIEKVYFYYFSRWKDLKGQWTRRLHLHLDIKIVRSHSCPDVIWTKCHGSTKTWYYYLINLIFVRKLCIFIICIHTCKQTPQQ